MNQSQASVANRMDVEKYGVRRLTSVDAESITIGASRPCGTVSIVPVNVQGYLVPWQRKDRSVHGRDILRRIIGMRNLIFENLRWLSENPEYFPEDWKGRTSTGHPLFMCFWGTDATDSETGEKIVLCTWWDRDAQMMDIGFRNVDRSFFGDNCPAAQATG